MMQTASGVQTCTYMTSIFGTNTLTQCRDMPLFQHHWTQSHMRKERYYETRFKHQRVDPVIDFEKKSFLSSGPCICLPTNNLIWRHDNKRKTMLTFIGSFSHTYPVSFIMVCSPFLLLLQSSDNYSLGSCQLLNEILKMSARSSSTSRASSAGSSRPSTVATNNSR